ncbi:MAG: hypothetical protein HPY82_02625 [Gammaproteobacteria bacterium]|nr:hypothetical protein [Gammaproteobacteria bacterium]
MSAQKIVRLMLPLVVGGIVGARRRAGGRLVEKLDEISFFTRSINEVRGATEIELQILDEEPLFNLFAGEASRFALASLITHQRSLQVQNRNAAWQAVEHYYSAYYAVHYLLRTTGVAVTNLDDNAVQMVKKNQLGQPSAMVVPSGLYTLRYDVAGKVATLTKRKKSSGGSHAEAWQLWVGLVDALSSNTVADIVEYGKEAIDLAAHKKFLVKYQGKYSPPELRAEINYQFKGGVWVFEKDKSQSVARVQASIASAASLAIGQGLDTDSLISNNKFIVNLARAIFEYSANSYPKAISRSLRHTYAEFIT